MDPIIICFHSVESNLVSLKQTNFNCCLEFWLDLLIARVLSTPKANEIAPIGSDVDSSWDCICVNCILVETLINWLLVSVLTPIANKLLPIRSGVDSLQDCSRVLTLIIKRIWVVPGWIRVLEIVMEYAFTTIDRHSFSFFSYHTSYRNNQQKSF